MLNLFKEIPKNPDAPQPVDRCKMLGGCVDSRQYDHMKAQAEKLLAALDRFHEVDDHKGLWKSYWEVSAIVRPSQPMTAREVKERLFCRARPNNMTDWLK